MSIKIHRRVNLKNPSLIAAWPGMGAVASTTAIYLRDILKAKKFAQIEPEDFFTYCDISIEKGLARVLELPQSNFYYWRNDGGNDLLIFLAEEQPKGKEAKMANEVIDFAKKVGTKRVYTFAAFPTLLTHKQKPEVWGTVNEVKLIKYLQKYGIKIMDRGTVSGLNGLLIGVAKKKGIEGICLLGEIPLYSTQFENPKASLAILNILRRILNIDLNLEEISYKEKVIEEQLDKLIPPFVLEKISEEQKERGEKVTHMIEDKEIERLLQLPDSVEKNIKRLFAELEGDISEIVKHKKAAELKKELDRWGLYRKYEDRFLDLFKKSQ